MQWGDLGSEGFYAKRNGIFSVLMQELNDGRQQILEALTIRDLYPPRLISLLLLLLFLLLYFKVLCVGVSPSFLLLGLFLF